MNLHSGMVVYRKELTDILRDRRTLLSMVFFPILIIPIFYLGVGALMKARMENLAEKRSVIAWLGPRGEATEIKQDLTSAEFCEVIDDLADTSQALSLLRERDIHAVVSVTEGFNQQLKRVLGGEPGVILPAVELFYDQTRQTSEMAADRVRGVIEEFRRRIVAAELVRRGLRSDVIAPFAINRVNIATPEQMGRFITGFFLPYLVILMVATGAMYPSIDMTAGEKERGTLETLLAAGVARGDIVFGKFLTVLTAALVTAALALVSLVFTFTMGVKMFEEARAALSLQLDPTIIWILIAAVLPLAVIFSALMMTLGLFAKSYREAQTYVSPIMIVIILPAMASMIPDIELTVPLALVPVLNVSLMLKEGLGGTLTPTLMVLTLGVNFIVAVGALWLVGQMFKREKVLFRG